MTVDVKRSGSKGDCNRPIGRGSRSVIARREREDREGGRSSGVRRSRADDRIREARSERPRTRASGSMRLVGADMLQGDPIGRWCPRTSPRQGGLAMDSDGPRCRGGRLNDSSVDCGPSRSRSVGRSVTWQTRGLPADRSRAIKAQEGQPEPDRRSDGSRFDLRGHVDQAPETGLRFAGSSTIRLESDRSTVKRRTLIGAVGSPIEAVTEEQGRLGRISRNNLSSRLSGRTV